MNINEIDIYDYFSSGFENDLKRINEADRSYTTIPYIMRDFLERCGAFHFVRLYDFLEYEELEILYDLQIEVLKKLNEKLSDRLKWHGARLDEHLGNVPAALVMVNCCNDLFNCFGMEFTTK